MNVKICLKEIDVEIPDQFDENTWKIAQEKIAEHFQQCAQENKVSPFISGMNPGHKNPDDYRKFFDALKTAAVKN